jgi:diguanylate cyclase (GGDEF)-like protein
MDHLLMFQKGNFFNKKLHSLFLLLILIMFFSCGCEIKENHIPKASQGKLDLSNWDFKKDGLVKLDGQWEFYYGQLLEPKEFKDNYENQPEDFFEIPNLFITTVNNNKLPKSSYGTMRLVVKLPPNENIPYGIKIRHILSASKIWINGQLVTSVGTVNRDANSSIGSFEHQLAFFNNDNNEVEIVIQMSNFNNITGKIGSIFFGTSLQIKREYIINIASDTFIIGSLFIMGIYHFALYYKRQKYKAPLYFGVFCLLIALRNSLVGDRVIYEIFPYIPFDLFNKIAYLTVYSSVPFIVMFFKELFSKELSRKIVYIINIVSILIGLITIFTSIHTYDTFLIYYEIGTVIFIIYVLIIIIKATINKYPGALIILFGFIVFSVSSIHDMLLQSGLLHTRSLMPFGLFVFIFSQSYMLAAKFSDAFLEIEKLVEENKAMYRDELTGILNRRGFYEQVDKLLKSALITDTKFILFYGDLNKLKAINDTFGHKEGDEAIKIAAYLLKNSLGKDDIVARMSGDEFVAIAVNKASEEDAQKIIELINSNYQKYNSISKKTYKLSISIGYSIYMPNSGTPFEELVQQADAMLYDNKCSPQNSFFNS